MYKEYLIALKSENITKSPHQEKLTSLINKKTIRCHLEKFIREYNILPEERTPLTVVKHVLKTLFWTIVYLAFCYLTFTWSFTVIQQYHDQETTTYMKAVINNHVTYLPNMTICLKINAIELVRISPSPGYNYMSAWSRFFEETVSPEGTFKVNESQIYDDEIYLSLLKYLAMIYEAERAWEPGLTLISTFHSKKSDEWIALKTILLPNIKRYNITLEQLKSVFDGKICSLRMFDFHTPPLNSLFGLYNLSSNENECIVGSKMSFIGMDTICFRLIGYQIYLLPLDMKEYIILYLYRNDNYMKWYQEFTIDLGSESRSTPRRATTRNETYAYYYNRFPAHVEISMDISVKALYRKLPYVKGEVQCSSDTSREECENKCLKGWIRANCHCSPTTFNLTADTSSYRYCTLNDYSTCLKKYTENETYLCTNKCVPLCEQWHYEYNLASSKRTKSDSRSANMEIRTKTFDYVIIEQAFTWNSFEEFIGALGGALGIWLGLDFVIIIEFIVKLATKVIKKILLRKGHAPEEDEHRKSGSIKQRGNSVGNGISSSNEVGSCSVRLQKKHKDSVSKTDGTSIRQINASEKQRTSRKIRESNIFKEKHVQQRRKHSDDNKAGSAILNDKMKNTDARDGRLQNQKVNKTDSNDATQDESTEHANSSFGRSWFLQKMLHLFLNGDSPTNKPVLFLRLVQKLFWAAIYLVGSVFTTLWCIELINLYLADEAIYFPSLIIKHTVSLPPPTLCICHRNRVYYEKYHNISTALLNYFGGSTIDRASFLQISNRKIWPEQLVSMALLYLSFLVRSEINNDVNLDYVNFTSEYNWQFHNSFGNDVDKSINDILRPKLLEWNVTGNELRQKLGAELARMIELKINFTNSTGTTDIVNDTSFYTTVITDRLICYGLSYSINFTDPGDSLEFSINTGSDKLKDTIPFFGGYILFSDYLLDPKGVLINDNSAALEPVYVYPYFEFKYLYITKTLISVDGLYTSRPAAKGGKYCSPNTTESYCRAQCRIKHIENLCNCSPTYWTTMIRPTYGLDECTFDRYMKCLNFNASDDLDCKDSCLPSCTARYYRSDSHEKYIGKEYPSTSVIRFSVYDGVHASIEEKPTFTFSEMLIKLGGTLGILLGFSIFSFYQVLVTAATLCFTFILKRTRIAQSPLLLKSLDKVKKSGIAQLISELYRQLLSMNICTMKKSIKVNEIGKNILLKTGYMIGLYATVRMSNDLFYSFKTGEPKHLVDLTMSTTIKLPSWTLCIPVNIIEFLTEDEIWHFKEKTDLAKKLYFNSSNDKEEFFHKLWPSWLIKMAYEYLTIYDIVERRDNQTFISALFSDSDICTSYEVRGTLSKYSLTSLMELDELLDRLNITILELKQNLVQKIRDIYKIEAVFAKIIDGAWNETVLNITDTTFIGETKICYKLPLDTVTFSSKSDYVFIFVDRESLPNPEDPIHWKPVTIDYSGRDISKEYLEDLDQRDELSNNIFGSTLSFWFGWSYAAKLDISGIYEAMPVSSGERQCSESKSMDTCQDECQKKKIERVCKCSPATRPSFPSNTNLTRCHLIDYKGCASSLVSNDTDFCELSCVPHCTHIKFKNMLSRYTEVTRNNVAEINITLNSFEYLSIKEVYKYSMTDFINEFGGILGLWIGLDILAIVDLCYWLVCKGCHTFRLFL